MFSAKTAAARAIGSLSRRSGRGGGTSLPGKALLRLAPDAIERLAARLDDGVVLVSATNGKTTSSTLAAAALGPDHPLCRNGAGANLLSGVASALLDAPSGARLGLFEVDEFALPEVARRTRPRALLLQNLFRDQLDRYGELELVAERWRAMAAALPPETMLVLCADDPVVSALGDGRDHVVRFGLDDPSVALRGPRRRGRLDHLHPVRVGVHATPPSTSATSATTAARTAATPGRRSTWRCATSTCAASTAVPSTIGGTRLQIGLPGIYNVENAAGAFALATALGVAPEGAAFRIGAAQAAFGRFERVVVGDRDAVLLLVKNPAGANEALRTLAPNAEGAVLLLALNDRIADGRDVSWIWDVDYETVLPHAGARRLQRHPGGRHRAARQVRRRRRDADRDRAGPRRCPRSRAGAGRRRRHGLRPADLHRDARAAAASLAERGLVRPYWEAAAT